MSLSALSFLASTLVGASAPSDLPIGVLLTDGRPRCTATLVASQRALTAGRCARGLEDAVVALADGAYAVARVHVHARADVAVLELASASSLTPLPVLTEDHLGEASAIVGADAAGSIRSDAGALLPGAVLVARWEGAPALSGIVDSDGTEIASRDILAWSESTQREGWFDVDEDEAAILAGVLLVGAAIGAAQGEYGEVGCQGGVGPDLLAALAVLVAIVVLRRVKEVRRA